MIDQDKRKHKYDSSYVDYLEVKTDLLEQYAEELVKNYPSRAKSKDLKSVFPDPPKLIQNNDTSKLKQLNSNFEALEEIVSTAWRVRKDEKGKTEFYGPLSGRQQVIETQEVEGSSNPSLGNGVHIPYTNDAFKEKMFQTFKDRFADYFYISVITLDEVKKWKFPSRDTDKQLLLCSIFAYASIYTHQKSVAEIFVSEAEAVLLDACRYNLNENVLQALLILSCFELGVARDSLSWIFDAMCASQAQYIGLHLENNNRGEVLPSQKTDKNGIISMSPVKSALFWSIILQDRYITTVLGRGCRIQYFRIKTPFYIPRLPKDSTDPEMYDNHMSEIVFSLHSRLWYIHDRSMSQIYSFKADYLHNSHRMILLKQGFTSLSTLYNSFPEEVILKPRTTDKRILLLHLSYYVVLILLHRSYLIESPTQILNLMIGHTQKAAKLTQRLNQLYTFRVLPYFAGYLVFQCAMLDLFVLASNNQKYHNEALERMEIYVNALKSFGTVWKRGMKDLNVLSSLAEKWSVKCSVLEKSYIYTMVSPQSSDATGEDLMDTQYQQVFDQYSVNFDESKFEKQFPEVFETWSGEPDYNTLEKNESDIYGGGIKNGPEGLDQQEAIYSHVFADKKDLEDVFNFDFDQTGKYNPVNQGYSQNFDTSTGSDSNKLEEFNTRINNMNKLNNMSRNNMNNTNNMQNMNIINSLSNMNNTNNNNINNMSNMSNMSNISNMGNTNNINMPAEFSNTNNDNMATANDHDRKNISNYTKSLFNDTFEVDMDNALNQLSSSDFIKKEIK
ncbi:hypothetical protein BVG19_g853 [[Candida] boidinii]|nr:hypothetical protein BVG19_g853 [[Candida] boidinii]OWB48750.1 metal ion binding protein [[Candida] boidinii]